jgi:hypothetical protein
MSETRIPRGNLPLGRSLFERGLTPGSSGNISVKLDDGGWLVTPTNASLGSLDPARMSRLGPDGRLVSGDAPTKEVPLHTALYQTRDRGARRGASAFDPLGGAVDAARDRSPRRAAADDAYYLMKCGQTALVPYYRPGDPAVADAIKGWPGNTRPCCSPTMGRWCRAIRWKRRLRDRGTGRDGESCICCCAG